jgi:PPOX class probable F420-dependent enzyme
MTDGSMTPDERDAFLRDQHVAIVAIDEPGRGPLALPIWYLVDDDGDVLLSMDGGSVKGRLLAAAGRATLTVQTETAPYRYVSVEGPVTIGPPTHDPLELAVRYLGPELGQWYVDTNPTTDATVTVRLRPEHWRTHDFAKLL